MITQKMSISQYRCEKFNFFLRISLWNVLHHRRLDCATVEVSMSVARRREDTTINHDDMEIFFCWCSPHVRASIFMMIFFTFVNWKFRSYFLKYAAHSATAFLHSFNGDKWPAFKLHKIAHHLQSVYSQR